MLESLLKIVVGVVAKSADITVYLWLEQDWRRKLLAIMLFLLLAIGGFWYLCVITR